MFDEIITYLNSVDSSSGKYSASQIDVTHLVEKHIKMGDSLEKAREVLQKNGFSFTESEVKTDMRVAYRIHATRRIEGSWWYVRTIAIFIGKSSHSKNVDAVFAKINLKTL
ncbi:MAG: hypothetical protein LBG78_06085 [Azoarcus sp.]|jgi:hypothetical protein|nr:hypothetical protein [Azoarcus sp.]